MLAIVVAVVSTSTAAAADSPQSASLDPLLVTNWQLPDIGGPVHDVVFSDDGMTAYASAPEAGEVVVLETSGWTVQDRIDVGGEPRGMDLLHDGSTLLVAISGTGEVIEVSTASKSVTSRIVLTDELGDDRTHDVREVSDDVILVTANPGSNGFAWVVRYDRSAPADAARVANESIIRAEPEIHAERGSGIALIAEGFSPNSLYILDTSDPLAPIISEDAHGSLQGTRTAALDQSRGELHLGSGQVVSTTDASVLRTGPPGLPALTSDGSTLYRFAERDFEVIDPVTMEIERHFVPSCGEFGVVDDVTKVILDPVEENLVILFEAGICLEPVDGSGQPPVNIRFEALGVGGPGEMRVQWLVLDTDFDVVFETSRRDFHYLELRLLPGDYYVLIWDMVDIFGWPYSPSWNDGRPLLSRSEPRAVTVVEDGTIVFDVSPFFFDVLDASQTFWDAIWWLQLTGITTGCGATSFCPKDYVTRGQMAAFLDRALDLPTGPPTPFLDDSGTFQQNIRNLYAAEITTGCAPDRFCTNDYVTREQMAAFLSRSMEADWPHV